MQQKWWTRLASEFVVIVLGVLVALAVADWRQSRADRQLEAYLIARLSDDLAADLELARLWTARRQWVLSALLSDLSDAATDAQPFVEPPDSILNPLRVRELLESQGRVGGPTFEVWDPVRAPLFTFEDTPPEFDVSDDAFQEIVVSGALQTLRDQSLRVELLRYYRTVADYAENARRQAEYQARLDEALGWVGVAVGDSPPLTELASQVSVDPRVSVVVRRAQTNLRVQQQFWSQIDNARLKLEGALAQAARR